jgi:hypothetical protein
LDLSLICTGADAAKVRAHHSWGIPGISAAEKERAMRVLPIVLIAAFAAGTYAEAQTGGESRREERRASPAEKACKTEIQQLCQGQKGKEAEQCLKNNESKLSSQCKGALQTPQK